jgi:hypothetical protein
MRVSKPRRIGTATLSPNPTEATPAETGSNRPSKPSCPSNTRSQRAKVPEKERTNILTSCVDELMATRPAGSVTNPRYSYAQPSRRTSAYSGAWSTPGGNAPQQQARPDNRDRESFVTRESFARDSYAPRGEPPQAESSGASSYDQYAPPQQQSGYYQQQLPNPNDYSPPHTPTRPAVNQQFAYPQQNTGLPSPEPDVEYPRAPPKPPMHSFTTRPATPPGSDVSQEKKKGKMSKLKRFSGFGKSKV